MFLAETYQESYIVLSELTSPIVIEWDQVNARQWASHLSTIPYAAYQQNFDYGEVLKEIGGKISRARILSGEECIGLAQVQHRKWLGIFSLTTIMRGPVWCRDDVSIDIKATALKELARTLPVKGLHSLIVLPENIRGKEEQRARFRRVMTGYHTVLIDLSADEDVIRKRFNGKWRNRLKAAEKSNLTIMTSGKKPERYDWLLKVEQEQQERIGYRALPLELVPAYHQRLGKGGVIVVEAKLEDERVGAMLFLRHGNGATYHIGWASDEGKALNTHNLLLWKAIQTLKKAGCRYTRFGWC